MSQNLNEIELDKEISDYLLQVDQAQQAKVAEVIKQASSPFDLERQVICNTAVRLYKLTGHWHLTPDRKKLVRKDADIPTT